MTRPYTYTTAVYEKWQRLNIDTIGPLPRSSKGNDSILVILDACTRFATLYATNGTTAEAAVDPLIDHIGTFACPSEILSDNGPQFVNELVAATLKAMAITHSTTIAYSKEENALVERVNKEVMRHLRALVFEIQNYDNWDRYLPIVQRIINTTVHSVLKVSPYSLVFGTETEDDVPMFVATTRNTTKPLHESVAKMLQIQAKLIKKANMMQSIKDEKHLQDAPRELTEFPVNSFVLVEYPTTRMGRKPPTKLHTQLKGPYRVITSSPYTGEYTLMNLVNNREENSIRVSRLRRFDYDPLVTDPAKIALRDHNAFFVEKIISLVETLSFDQSCRS